MHSGNVATIPDVRKQATLSFCHASRSVRITTAILVSKFMGCFSAVIPGWSAGPDPESRASHPGDRAYYIEIPRFGAKRRPGMTVIGSYPLASQAQARI